jgi:hypothetical protein
MRTLGPVSRAYGKIKLMRYGESGAGSRGLVPSDQIEITIATAT